MKQTRQTLTSALVITIVLAAAAAGGQAQPPAHERPMAMAGPGEMMERCEAMMAERKEMQQEMEAMDQRLQSLLQRAKEAKGAKKVDALTAVVEELVAQRDRMAPMMMERSPAVMSHMMQHMRMGMMQGMEQAMSCPMMQTDPSEEESTGGGAQTEHHPEN